MSDDYSKQIEQIRKATSLEEIQAVARQYSAKATGEGGILYSRGVGNLSSMDISLELASKTGEPIINNTPRARFLDNAKVGAAIQDAAERIFVAQGQDLAQAGKSVVDFLYGNPKAVAQSATSLEGCLWGEASHEFAGSLRGDIKLVATNANIERVFGKVELPAVLENPNVRTLGGQPVGELKTLYAQGGADAVLPKVQAQFIEAAPKGIFVSPDQIGAKAAKVTLSRELATALGSDGAEFTPAAELSASGKVVRAPIGMSAAVAADEVAIAARASAALDVSPSTGFKSAAAPEVEAAAARGLRPGMVMKGAAVAGVAAVAYDFATTGHQVLKLEAQGNTTGSESAKTHFVGRNVGGIGGGIAVGFLAGAGYGLAGGSPTGPGALVTAGVGGVVGGVGGAFLGEKSAQQKDIDRVFTQQDKDGNEWSRDLEDPKGTWTRIAETQQVKAATTTSTESGTQAYSKVRYVAGDVLANQLNYKSANASYELGLANVSKPQDPFSMPPGKGDARSLDGGNWARDPQSHAWTREVVTDRLEHGIKISHTETAGPQRAAELDQASKLVIAQNAANMPAAIAARYQVAYNQFGWNQNGEVPAAVKDASTRTESLQASDGNTYARGAGGEWTAPGTLYGTNQASGNVRDELNATYQSQQAGLLELSAHATEALANPTLPKPMSMRGMVAFAYGSSGVARTEAQIDDATAAVARTHARNGLDQGGRPFSLVLQPDPRTGRPGPNSAIVTMMDDGRDGILSESKMVPKGITTAGEIKQAENPALEGQGPTARNDIRAPEPVVMRSSLPANDSTATPGNLAANFAPPLKLPADLRDPLHPGNVAYQWTLGEVHGMETIRGIPHGPHSEKVAAALLVEAERNKQGITSIAMDKEGQVIGLEHYNAFDPGKRISIDPKQAQPVSMEQFAAQWSQLRSPHLTSSAPSAERTREQAQALGQLSPADQAMFAKIRGGVLPSVTDDHVLLALRLAKEDGITDASKLQGATMVGDRLLVTGNTPGFRAAVNVSEPAPSPQETVQQTLAFNQQREQQLAMETMQRNQDNPARRGLTA